MNDLIRIENQIIEILQAYGIDGSIFVYYNEDYDFEIAITFHRYNEKDILKFEEILKNHWKGEMIDIFFENILPEYIFRIKHKNMPINVVKGRIYDKNQS